MDMFSNTLNTSSSSMFNEGRTIIPGPLPTFSSSQGRILTERSVSSSFGHPSQNSQIILPPPPPLRLYNHHGAPQPQSQLQPVASTSSPTSILRSNFSEMVPWLTTTSTNVNSNMSQTFSSVPMSSVGYEDFEAPQIPKPYNELSSMDCAHMLGKTIRSIIVNTCNDTFRQQCFSKLGVVSSAEVEREIRTRLSSLIVQDAERKQAAIKIRFEDREQSEEEEEQNEEEEF